MHSGSGRRSSSSICSSMAVSGMVSSFIGIRWPDRAASGLEIAVHQVDLLEPPEPLADVLRPDLADALDAFELGVGGREDLVEAAEDADDVLHHEPRQARDAPEDAVAAGGDGEVEGVDLAVVAEELREAPEVEQVLVREPRDPVERHGEGVV